MVEITKYRIELVKESSSIYNITDDKISTSKNVYEIIKDKFNIGALTEEMFGIVCLNTKNKIIGVFEVSYGDLDSTIVHPREVFKRAMLVNSSAIILFHNHPSGEVEPSDGDKHITKNLIEAGKILNMRILDHIIACEDSFFSFKERGYC